MVAVVTMDCKCNPFQTINYFLLTLTLTPGTWINSYFLRSSQSLLTLTLPAHLLILNLSAIQGHVAQPRVTRRLGHLTLTSGFQEEAIPGPSDRLLSGP